MKLIFLTFFTAVFGLAIYLFFHLEFYKSVSVRQGSYGPLNLVYKPHVGPYHEIGATITDVEAWARTQNLRCARTFGQYLDDPDAVDADRLRSRGGCLLDQPLTQVPQPFATEAVPVKDYVIAEFNGSPAIGPFKAYPAARKFMAEHHLQAEVPVIEIYLVEGNKVTTTYLFTLKKDTPP